MGPEELNLWKLEDSIKRFRKDIGLPIWITEFDWQGGSVWDHRQHAVELENFFKLMFR